MFSDPRLGVIESARVKLCPSFIRYRRGAQFCLTHTHGAFNYSARRKGPDKHAAPNRRKNAARIPELAFFGGARTALALARSLSRVVFVFFVFGGVSCVAFVSSGVVGVVGAVGSVRVASSAVSAVGCGLCCRLGCPSAVRGWVCSGWSGRGVVSCLGLVAVGGGGFSGCGCLLWVAACPASALSVAGVGRLRLLWFFCGGLYRVTYIFAPPLFLFSRRHHFIFFTEEVGISPRTFYRLNGVVIPPAHQKIFKIFPRPPVLSLHFAFFSFAAAAARGRGGFYFFSLREKI